MSHLAWNSPKRWLSVLSLVVALALAGRYWQGPSAAQGQQPAGAGNPPQMVDVLIAFEQTPGPQERRMVRGHGGVVRRSFWLVPAVAARVPENALPALARAPGVALIEPDRERRLIKPLEHNLPPGADPDLEVELDNSWGVKHIGAGWVHQGHDPVLGIDLPPNVGTGVGLAVLDTGLDTTSDITGLVDYEFDHNYAGGYDIVNDDNDPFDDNSHGTFSAGIVAAQLNGVFVVGAAPDVRLYVIKVLDATGGGLISDVVAGVEVCVEHNMALAGVPGAQTLPEPPAGVAGPPEPILIASCSFGGRRASAIEEAAFDNAYALGILSVASAGNSGKPNGNGNNVEFPAAYTSVIAVGATDQSNARGSFSATGGTLELSGPGVDIKSTLPNLGGATKSGTSAAAPHVAGVAALVFAANPGCDNVAVRAVLNNTAIPLGDSHHYGSGLVDAVAAVLAVCESPPPPPPPPPGGSGEVTVDAVSYSTYGGQNQDNHLRVTVALVDGSEPVAGALVDVTLTLFDELDMEVGSWFATEITDGAGEVSLTLNNAPLGCYSTTVTDVVADGMTWDGLTPGNEFCK